MAEAGADVIAIDATQRPRPDYAALADYIAAIHEETGLPVLADISTFEEGAGGTGCRCRPYFDYHVGVHGVQPQSCRALTLTWCGVSRVCSASPLIAEGRYHAPDQAVAGTGSRRNDRRRGRRHHPPTGDHPAVCRGNQGPGPENVRLATAPLRHAAPQHRKGAHRDTCDCCHRSAG